jgi:hypothetical protein
MNDLRNTLDLVAGDVPGATDPVADLARARTALTRRTRRRYSVGLAALVLGGVGGVGVGIVRSGDDTDPGRRVADATTTGGVTLVAKTFDAAPYTFGLTPQGWSVQAQTPTAVTIVPDDGSVSTDENDFRGKLVIMFDGNALDGRRVERDGRSFWIGGDSGYTTISTPTLAGEPEGVVRIQFPDDAGWDESSMLAFLGSVHVGEGAVQGVG